LIDLEIQQNQSLSSASFWKSFVFQRGEKMFGTELQICRLPTHTRVNAFLHGRRWTVPSPTQLFFLSRPTVAAPSRWFFGSYHGFVVRLFICDDENERAQSGTFQKRRVPRSFKLSVRQHCLLYSSSRTHTVRQSVSKCRLHFARPTTRYRYCRYLRRTVPQPTSSIC